MQRYEQSQEPPARNVCYKTHGSMLYNIKKMARGARANLAKSEIDRRSCDMMNKCLLCIVQVVVTFNRNFYGV